MTSNRCGRIRKEKVQAATGGLLSRVPSYLGGKDKYRRAMTGALKSAKDPDDYPGKRLQSRCRVKSTKREGKKKKRGREEEERCPKL